MGIARAVIWAGAAALLLTASVAGATVYSEAYYNEDLGPSLGQAGSDSPTWGVAFTAPGGNLTSWSFITDGVGTGQVGYVEFVVAPWSGHSLSGAPLYTSAPKLVSSASDATLTFSGFNLALTQGQSYIAFLDTDDGDPSPQPFFLNIGGNYVPGLTPATVLSSKGENDYFGYAPLTDQWRSPGLGDGPAFSATFGPVGSGAPEPAAWAMMILGLAGIGAALRSRLVVARTIRDASA